MRNTNSRARTIRKMALLAPLLVAGCNLEFANDSAAPIDPNRLSDDNAAGQYDSITVSWQAPTLNEDGSPLTNLAGYKIYYGLQPGVYSSVIDINNVGMATYVIDGLAPGTYYIALTSVNAAGNESLPSGEVSRTIIQDEIPARGCTRPSVAETRHCS